MPCDAGSGWFQLSGRTRRDRNAADAQAGALPLASRRLHAARSRIMPPCTSLVPPGRRAWPEPSEGRGDETAGGSDRLIERRLTDPDRSDTLMHMEQIRIRDLHMKTGERVRRAARGGRCGHHRARPARWPSLIPFHEGSCGSFVSRTPGAPRARHPAGRLRRRHRVRLGRSRIVDTFARLSGDVFLRTGDAVHLLSAREFGCTVVYSNDRHLLAAAPHVGIKGRDVIGPAGSSCARGTGYERRGMRQWAKPTPSW